MKEWIRLTGVALHSLKVDGLAATAGRLRNYIKGRTESHTVAHDAFYDVLFINGCDPKAVPHPPRYRITHQREQLLSCGVTSHEVFYLELQQEQVRNSRVFVFFRCPYTEAVGAFIQEAKRLHKAVLYDIDDLVIDTCYTDTIPYVQALSPEEKACYDDGVIRMGRTLSLCDAAITTTERLAVELRKFVPEVYINRNTASERMLALSSAALAARSARHRGEEVRLGYFSGSITHNADFEQILPAIVRVLEENPQATLHVVGELTLPETLRPYQSRVVRRAFCPWEELPGLIASVDVNLAPLEDTVFNQAKSENKWVEAALVQVPTVASDVGAFRRMINNGETGFLCKAEEDWYRTLTMLVRDAETRARVGLAAAGYCRAHCATMYTGFPLAEYIRAKMTPNIAFVLPSLHISGGVRVALKHAELLHQSGMDVMLISKDKEHPDSDWTTAGETRLPVLVDDGVGICGRIDKAVATLYSTAAFFADHPNIHRRFYLVQNFEVDFYEPGIKMRMQACQSYVPALPTQFITISRWCQQWLRDTFRQDARYARNGIDAASFRPYRRSLSGRVRVLIEGDCDSYYKNVDESFRIAALLPADRFEISYLSYHAEPKAWYRVDRFYHRVPFDKVTEVYAACDILIKSSILESFSYPPLEMMASGGYAVVAPNGGNAEYLVDRENCLLYPTGDLNAAVEAINRLLKDPDLQQTLYENGRKTAESRDWAQLEQEILSLYE